MFTRYSPQDCFIHDIFCVKARWGGRGGGSEAAPPCPRQCGTPQRREDRPSRKGRPGAKRERRRRSRRKKKRRRTATTTTTTTTKRRFPLRFRLHCDLLFFTLPRLPRHSRPRPFPFHWHHTVGEARIMWGCFTAHVVVSTRHRLFFLLLLRRLLLLWGRREERAKWETPVAHLRRPHAEKRRRAGGRDVGLVFSTPTKEAGNAFVPRLPQVRRRGVEPKTSHKKPPPPPQWYATLAEPHCRPSGCTGKGKVCERKTKKKTTKEEGKQKGW